MAKKKVSNPILEVSVSDLYEKDPEDFTPEDRERILAYHRELRRVYQQEEAEKSAKRTAKKAKTIEEHASSGF